MKKFAHLISIICALSLGVFFGLSIQGAGAHPEEECESECPEVVPDPCDCPEPEPCPQLSIDLEPAEVEAVEAVQHAYEALHALEAAEEVRRTLPAAPAPPAKGQR